MRGHRGARKGGRRAFVLCFGAVAFEQGGGYSPSVEIVGCRSGDGSVARWRVLLRLARGFPTATLALVLAACCPTRSGEPGDQGAVAWVYSPSDEPPTVIDCHGAERGSIIVRRSNTTLRRCIIRGDIRIMGPWRNGNDPRLREPSRRADYVAWVRARAPRDVTLEDVTIIGGGTVPLYIAPGVVGTTIRDVRVLGASRGPMVYLGAESSRTTIVDTTIDGRRASREAVAIDASDHNRIERSHILGDVTLYRNCGEAGVSRHTTPSDNFIRANVIRGRVVENARDGDRCYCDQDDDSAYGSGQSDLDHARRNVVQ